jgi:hypothetical protein
MEAVPVVLTVEPAVAALPDLQALVPPVDDRVPETGLALVRLSIRRARGGANDRGAEKRRNDEHEEAPAHNARRTPEAGLRTLGLLQQ